MNPIRRVIPWVALAVVAALGWLFWPGGKPDGDSLKTPPIAPGARVSPRPPGSTPEKPPSPAADHQAEAADLARQLSESIAAFESSTSPEKSREILRKLRDAIRGADPLVAGPVISGFLQSGRDAGTRLPFVVGPEGMMETVPSVRTALLDLLPAIDPEAALALARGVMDGKQSPDEYALALRNLAWNDFKGDLKSELSVRLEEMIASKPWKDSPSAGFLEALDAAVEIRDEKTFGSMLRLNAGANVEGKPALARASFVALDRMVVRSPALLVRSFSSDPGLSGIPPEQRASLMSRLDLTDPVQCDSLVRYLTEAGHGADELDYFARLFPNGNYLHGNWLITTLENTESIQSRREADRAVLERLDLLIERNPAAPMAATLASVRERLRKSLAGESKQ